MRYLRVLLTCWLMLVLPLQGYASVVMLACSSEAGTAADADEMTPMSAAGTDQAQQQPRGLEDMSASVGALGSGDHHGCSLCVVCSACHGFAMYVGPSISPSQEVPQVAPVGPLHPLATTTVHPLDKPPRT